MNKKVSSHQNMNIEYYSTNFSNTLPLGKDVLWLT